MRSPGSDQHRSQYTRCLIDAPLKTGLRLIGWRSMKRRSLALHYKTQVIHPRRQMQPVPRSQITELLREWSGGDQRALGDLVALLQPELHKIARHCLNNERPEHTLQATALINEAYLKLVDISRLQFRDRAHFLAVASGVMRRVLVDYARARGTGKRGGAAQRVDFEESIVASLDPDPNVARLDDAIGALEKFDPRKARIVEMRYFGGMTAEEIAEVLGVSPQTVHRDWHLARSWLARELRSSHGF